MADDTKDPGVVLEGTWAVKDSLRVSGKKSSCKGGNLADILTEVTPHIIQHI